MELRIFILVVLINSVFTTTAAAVKFFVYSGRHNQIPVEISFEEFDQIDFDRTKTIRLLSHGWMDTHNSFWIEPTKNNLMSVHETNVISINWEKDASHTYAISAGKIKGNGEDVAKWIIALSKKLDLPMEKFHLIGHSLGAHLFGFAAKSVFLQTNSRIGRITGLDPAGPNFNDKPPSDRLDATDANLVDIIHTSASLGYKNKLGHIDFWPNGGEKQLGCKPISNCHHNRATYYYAESVTSRNFTAWKCESYDKFDKGECNGNEKTVMGELVNKSARGSFHLRTNKEAPFGCNC